MRAYRLVSVCSLGGLLALNWAAFGAEGPQDAKALRGTWNAVKTELAGEPVNWTVTLTMNNDQYTILANGRC